MNFDKVKKVHLTGIKGVGMTALALYLSDMGINVTGSDVSEIFVTDELLKKRGINYHNGINMRNVSNDCDLLITTAAHGGLNNEEVLEAKKKNIPVLTYAEALADLASLKEAIAVCGVGGKSTVSSMISVLLDSAGMNPSFIVGVGSIFPIGVSGRYVKEGRNFICEADDYVISPGIDNRAKFSLINPKIIVVTNIEYDHPDVYKNIDETKETFLQFFNKLPKYGFLIACKDNKNTYDVSLKAKAKVVTYGFDKTSDYQIKNVRFLNQKTSFDIYIKKRKRLVEGMTINTPGEYNVQNATAVFAVGDFIGIDEEKIKFGIGRYLGCRRRFEEMPYYKGAKFFDDYAHHPSEITAVLKAVRQWFKDERIVAIFQPHTYSRTKALFKEFSRCFSKADVVGIMDIYASAREKEDLQVNSKLLAEEIKKHNKNSFYLGSHSTTLKWIDDNIKAKDVVLTLGAGDVFHLYDEIKKRNG